MKTFYYNELSKIKLTALLKRTSIDLKSKMKSVEKIVIDVKLNGDKAVMKYAKKYDNYTAYKVKVDESEIIDSENKISKELKNAIDYAAANIEKFHFKQKPFDYAIETVKGVNCSRIFKPIENVGLYIPGGSSVLISTMLMLGIPAKIAGCKRILICSPVKNNFVEPALLYTVKKCGINEFYKIGGAHAIAAMAYGTKSIKKVDKIFGPGNQYVTAAKALVSTDINGCSIDMLAGPSEVLIIADESAKPSFIAADLLSQAEHGVDSQVILLATSEKIVLLVNEEINIQLKSLPRKNIISESLKNSFTLVLSSIEEAIDFSNSYAPEHLIINTKNAEKYIPKISNAGSVFLGEYSPESAGDYSSGTNHSLPTYGYAKSIGGVCVESFMKNISIQKITRQGLNNLSSSIIKLAELEKLEAHSNAVKIRL